MPNKSISQFTAAESLQEGDVFLIERGTENLKVPKSVIDSTIAANSAVAANTAKEGITAQQAADILTNNAKRSYPSEDETKLAGIEDGATADQTGAEIKTLYEGQADTNAFTDAEKSKLGAIEAGAEVNMTATEIVAAIDGNLGTDWKQPLTTEQVQDIIGALFQAGTHTNITVTYDDASNSISLAATGGGGGLTQEQAEDIVANLVAVTGGGINVAYDDPAGTLTFSLTGESYTTAEKTKLAGIATGATQNSSDATLLDRANHTGNQAISTVTGLQTALDGKANSSHTHTLSDVSDAGTAAALDVPATGNAAVGEVVKGNDTRLSDARTPTAHTHDDRYYTESEVDSLLGGKSDTGHTHDDRYYTETESDALLAAKVAVADIVNNLTSTATNQPLSAAQGKALKDLIDSINAVLLSDESTLDTLQEVVDFIELNRSDLDSLSISSIAGLQTALDGKAAASHTHTASQVTDFDTEVSNNADVAANTSARHSHANKALLDTYTQTEANLADAVSKKHDHSNKAVLDATTASFTTADEAKLDGIEAGADVTDAANVDAAGAVMNSDTSTAAMGFVVDEDDMSSNSATKVPTQQSVKAFVEANAGGSSFLSNKFTTASTWAALDSLAGETISQVTIDASQATGGQIKAVVDGEDQVLVAGGERATFVVDPTSDLDIVSESIVSIASTTYESKTFSISSYDSNSSDIFMSPDGLHFFCIGSTNDRVWHFDLGTPGDITTATHDSVSFYVGSQTGNPDKMTFSSDGTKMYIGYSGTVWQYTLSTPWDLTTASYDSKTLSTTYVYGLWISDDGNYLFVGANNGQNGVVRYPLSTPFDISTASATDQTMTVQYSSAIHGCPFSADGKTVYTHSYAQDKIVEYSLSTAWDLTTAVYVGEFQYTTQYNTMNGFTVNELYRKMYLPSSIETVYQYSIESAFGGTGIATVTHA